MDTTRLENSSARIVERDANRDPLSGAPGAHPVGVGAGAAGGGVAGAAIGAAVGGPIGAGVGAVVGAVAGGLGGKGVAEVVNPTAEHDYWRVEYAKRPYIASGATYDHYAPAYQFGWESYEGHGTSGKSFNEVEPVLQREWENRRVNPKMTWMQARDATSDAWHRVESCRGRIRDSK